MNTYAHCREAAMIPVTHPEYPPKLIPKEQLEKFELFGWESKLPEPKPEPKAKK